MRRRYVAYIRTANIDDYAIKMQKGMIEEYARRNNINLDYYYIDDGYSGTDLNRPQLRQLLRDVKSRKVTNGILYLDNTRLGRDRSVISEIVNKVSKSEVELISTIKDEHYEIMMLTSFMKLKRSDERKRNMSDSLLYGNRAVIYSPYKSGTVQFEEFKRRKIRELEKKGIYHISFKHSNKKYEGMIKIENR